MADCPNCEGLGKKVQDLGFSTRIVTCPTCRGSGKVEPPWDTKQICPECDGFGLRKDPPIVKGVIVGQVRCLKCDGFGVI